MKRAFLYIWGKILILSGKIEYEPVLVNDFPKPGAVEANKIYIVGNAQFQKWAIMQCPCGCNEQLTLSLMKKHRPNWDVDVTNQKTTLSPSVWKNEGCRSHFFLRKGKIEWVKN